MARKKAVSAIASAVKSQGGPDLEWNEFCTKESQELNRKITALVNEYCKKWEADGVPPHVIATLNMMICLDAMLLSGGLAALAYPDPVKFYTDAIPQLANNSIPFFQRSFEAFQEAITKIAAVTQAATEDPPTPTRH